MTRNEIILEAYRKCGFGNFETPTSTDYDVGATNLNAIILDFVADGMQIWKRVKYTVDMSDITTVSGATVGDGQTIDTGAKPVRLVSANRVYDSTVVPLEIYERERWFQIPTPSQTGAPNAVYLDTGKTTGKMYCWPLPDSDWQTNGTFEFDIVSEFDETASSSDVPDFPSHWNMALIYALAAALAPNLGLPLNERTALERQAERLHMRALSNDNEYTSIYIKVK